MARLSSMTSPRTHNLLEVSHPVLYFLYSITFEASIEAHNRSIAYEKKNYSIDNVRQQGYIYAKKGPSLNKAAKI